MADAAAPRQRLALTVILIAMGGLAVWFAGIGPYLGAIEENARKKMVSKNLDIIVANDVSRPDTGFHSDTNAVKVLTSDDKNIGIPLMGKDRVADRVLDAIVKYRRRKLAR